MKLIILQENFLKGLNIVSRIASSNKNSLPILNNILLEAHQGVLDLITTNLEIAVKSSIRSKIEKEGKITIPAQILTSYINLLESGPLTLNLEVDELEIKTKNSKTKIKGISAEDFPIIPQVERKHKYVIQSDFLKKCIESVGSCVSSSETRMEISGLLFNFNSPENGKLNIVGTDSYRLAEVQTILDKNSSEDKISVIVPLKTVQEVSKNLEDKKDVEIYLSENQVLFVNGEDEIVSRLISGQFPDYKSIIPKNFRSRATLDKELFLKAVKLCGLFTKSGINDINIKIKAEENKIVVSSTNNQLGENVTEIDCQIYGEDNEIVFNYRFLLDGLLTLNQDEIILEMIDDATPAILRAEKEKDYIYLIMPIKHQEINN